MGGLELRGRQLQGRGSCDLEMVKTSRVLQYCLITSQADISEDGLDSCGDGVVLSDLVGEHSF